MSIYLNEALENEIVSSSLADIIPRHCKCGKEIVFSDSFRKAKCKSDKCAYSIINRICTLNDKLGIGLIEEDIDKLAIKLKLSTPYQILMLDEAYKSNIIKSSDIHNIDSVIQNIENVKKNKYFVKDIVNICGIETLMKVSSSIFGGFNTVEEAYNEIERGQVSFISERLGISNQDSSILSVEIYKIINDIKDEILFGETQLNIVNEYEYRLNIAFADNVVPYINKRDYVQYINSISKYKFNHVCSISDDVDILIRNASGNSNKSRAARIINDKFVAESMNSGSLSLNDINRIDEKQLKPIGCKIYICGTDELVNRLHKLENT